MIHVPGGGANSRLHPLRREMPTMQAMDGRAAAAAVCVNMRRREAQLNSFRAIYHLLHK